MVSYDTTQIALFVSLVLMMAAVGVILVFGVLAKAWIGSRPTRETRPEPRRRTHLHLAFHH